MKNNISRVIVWACILVVGFTMISAAYLIYPTEIRFLCRNGSFSWKDASADIFGLLSEIIAAIWIFVFIRNELVFPNKMPVSDDGWKSALHGLQLLIRFRQGGWFHIAFTLIIINRAIVYNVTSSEWCLLILAVLSTWIAAALRLVFECFEPTKEMNVSIRDSKAVAFGAALFTAVAAIIIALVVFYPHFKV